MSDQVTWTGCFEVLLTERAERFGENGIYGAFVNAVAYAYSDAHFLELVTQALDDEGYELLDIQDVAPITLADCRLPQEELELIVDELANDAPVAFGYFHAYPKEGLDA